MTGAAMATAITFLTYNILKVVYIQYRFKMQPAADSECANTRQIEILAYRVGKNVHTPAGFTQGSHHISCCNRCSSILVERLRRNHEDTSRRVFRLMPSLIQQGHTRLNHRSLISGLFDSPSNIHNSRSATIDTNGRRVLNDFTGIAFAY